MIQIQCIDVISSDLCLDVISSDLCLDVISSDLCLDVISSDFFHRRGIKIRRISGTKFQGGRSEEKKNSAGFLGKFLQIFGTHVPKIRG